MNCSEEFLELVQFILTLWGILIEHSIASTLWEWGKPIQGKPSAVGKPISSLKLIVPLCQRQSLENLLVADTFQKSFPSTFFFFFKSAEAGMRARITRPKEKSRLIKEMFEKRSKLDKKRHKCQACWLPLSTSF